MNLLPPQDFNIQHITAQDHNIIRSQYHKVTRSFTLIIKPRVSNAKLRLVSLIISQLVFCPGDSLKFHF
mgnify:CR=1 FL=1